MAIIDKFTEQELREIVEESSSYKEVLKKLGYKTTSGSNNKTLKNRLERFNISTEHFQLKSQIKRSYENVFCENSTASQAVLRRWYLDGNYSKYQCSECGLSNLWNGKEIKLQLDHISGNNKDNRLENLRWLCPNCHSQTDTYCGKHLKKKDSTNENNEVSDLKKIFVEREKTNKCIDCGKLISLKSLRCETCNHIFQRVVERPDKEELKQILFENNGSFTKVGSMFGVSDNTIRKWCKGYDLPHKSSDYKKQEQKKDKQPLKIFKVQQLDKMGNIINTYDSIRQAEKETGIFHITEASDPNNSTRKSAGGYIWVRIS